jgi:hypothetical protein
MCGRMNGSTEHVIVVDIWKRKEYCVKESGRHQQRNNPCFSFLLWLALAVSVSGLLRALDGEVVILCVRYWCTSFTKICTSSVPSIFCCKFLFQLSFWTCFVWGAKLCMTLLLIYGSRYSDCRSLLRRYATLLSFSASFLFFFFSLSQRSIQVSRCCMDASSTSWFGPAKVSLSSDESRARREFL